MPTLQSPSLDSIRADLDSPSADKRGVALDRLIRLMQERPALRPAARELFERTIQTDNAARPRSAAVAGLEQLVGPDVTRPLWVDMLSNPDPKYVYQAALRICHPAHAPLVRELLESERDGSVQTAYIRALGAMRDKQAVPLLMRMGNAPGAGVRLWVFTALGLIGDPSVIGWLEQFRNDPTPIPDERGFPRTLGDEAVDAIRQLSAKAGVPQPTFPLSNMARADQSMQHNTPPPLPTLGAEVARLHEPPPLARFVTALGHSAAALPLLAVAVQIAWLFCMVLVYIFICGDEPPPKLTSRWIDVVAIFPSICGVIAAVVVIVLGAAPGWWRRLLVLIGLGICGLFLLAFYNHRLFVSP